MPEAEADAEADAERWGCTGSESGRVTNALEGLARCGPEISGKHERKAAELGRRSLQLQPPPFETVALMI